MIRLVAVAFVLAVATSAQAMSPAPLHQSDGMTTSLPSQPALPPHPREWRETAALKHHQAGSKILCQLLPIAL